jgi:hypothetical protein
LSIKNCAFAEINASLRNKNIMLYYFAPLQKIMMLTRNISRGTEIYPALLDVFAEDKWHAYLMVIRDAVIPIGNESA